MSLFYINRSKATTQANHLCDLRHCRYIGESKTHVQHLATAAAVNLVRIGRWLCGEEIGKTRVSRFARLASSNVNACPV